MLLLQLHVCKAARPAGLAYHACAGVRATQLNVFSSRVYFDYPVQVTQQESSDKAKPYISSRHLSTESHSQHDMSSIIWVISRHGA